MTGGIAGKTKISQLICPSWSTKVDKKFTIKSVFFQIKEELKLAHHHLWTVAYLPVQQLRKNIIFHSALCFCIPLFLLTQMGHTTNCKYMQVRAVPGSVSSRKNWQLCLFAIWWWAGSVVTRHTKIVKLRVGPLNNELELNLKLCKAEWSCRFRL